MCFCLFLPWERWQSLLNVFLGFRATQYYLGSLAGIFFGFQLSASGCDAARALALSALELEGRAAFHATHGALRLLARSVAALVTHAE